MAERGGPAGPPRVDALLAQISALPPAERLAMLARCGELSVALGVGVRAFRHSAGGTAPAEKAEGEAEGQADGSSSPSLGSEDFVVPLGRWQEAFGCPWCRRPLVLAHCSGGCNEDGLAAAAPPPTGAICALLYGAKARYFLGACVLGHGLRRESAPRILLHTPDLPESWRGCLRAQAGWRLQEVEYLKGNEEVSSRLFHRVWYSRFRDVFTKLQVLALPFDKVLLLDLDLLVRGPVGADLLALRAPAALVRGDPAPQHGERVPYQRFWENYERRQFDGVVELLPRHQQSSGINAGVMVLPGRSGALLERMRNELRDWDHPEHFPTYMPEQEYLARWCGTFLGPRAWTHVACRYNFEVDKDCRVPFDFTSEHKRYKQDVAQALSELLVVHFSGSLCKPWDLLFASVEEAACDVPLEPNAAAGDQRQACWGAAEAAPAERYVGPPAAGQSEEALLRGRFQDPLTVACLSEWLQQFREAFAGVDVDGLLAGVGR